MGYSILDSVSQLIRQATRMYLTLRITVFKNSKKMVLSSGLGVLKVQFNGQSNAPFGVGIDSSGNVYVVDSGNNRIQKFKNSGTFIRTWVILVLWLKRKPVL